MKVEVKNNTNPKCVGYSVNNYTKIKSNCGQFVIKFTPDGVEVHPNDTSYYWTPDIRTNQLFEGDQIILTL